MPPFEAIEEQRARAPEILKIDVTGVATMPVPRLSPGLTYVRYGGTAVVESVIRSVSGVTAGTSILLDYETIPPVDALPPEELFESLGHCHQPIVKGRCAAFLRLRGHIFEPVPWFAFGSAEWHVGSDWPHDALRMHMQKNTGESYWDLLDRSHPLLPPRPA